MKALKIAGAVLASLVVIVLGLLFVGVPSSYLTSAIQSRVEQETGYRLTIAGATRIGVWPSLNVTLNDVTLEKPGEPDADRRVTIGQIEADMTLASVWAGHPKITALSIKQPVVNVPLLRQRLAQAPAPSRAPASHDESPANSLAIDRVTITDGAIAFSNLRDRVNDRIGGLNADIRIGEDRQVNITGSAEVEGRPLKFTLKATAPTLPLDRQNIPVEMNFDSSVILQAPLTAKAEIRINGPVVLFNGVSGTLGDGAFNGWASVDFSSKPLVKLDLDFQRLDVAKAAATTSSSQATQDTPVSPGWSNASVDVNGLNYIDAQARISAAELNIGAAHFAPVAIEAVLANGLLKCGFSNWGAYDGQLSGEMTADVSTGDPVYTLHTDIVGVRALPLLRGLADFDKVDGKMQAKLVLRSAGNSQRAVMANLSGNIFTNVRNGAIKDLNVAQMIRSLTSGSLSGWQDNPQQSTDLSQLSASFRVEKGQATTGDLNLVGPLVRMTGTGTVDIGEKSLALRVEPKLVMTTQGQGRANDPAGFGIPVAIDGPWANPRISADVAGLTDNPDGTYSKLKEMGKGLLGGDGSSGSNNAGNGLSGQLGETIGNLIQQGLGQSRGQPGTAPGRSIPPPAQRDPAQPAPQDTPQDSQPMNDVLKQLFNR